jgi:hypothetical protein
MSQSRTLCIGMAVHNESIAVASVAHDHGAEVTSLGSIGTRQCDRDPLLRKRPSQATPLVFVSEAGPGGSWLSRSLTNKDDDCWGAIPTAGTTPARRALGEGAWADRSPAPGSRPLPLRRETPPKMRQASRGKAQVRRCHRSRRLVAKGPHATVVPGAMARELVGCLGAMAKALPVTASGHKTAGPFTPHSESCRRALEEPPPRGGGTLDGVRSP